MAHYDPDTVLPYLDASFAPIAADSKPFEGARSHQCIILTIAMVPIFWQSKRQTIVSTTVAEAELIAECDAFIAQKGMAELVAERLQAFQNTVHG